jgi:hypothetical protein
VAGPSAKCHLPLTRGARLSSLSPPRPTEHVRLAGETEAARSSRCSLNRIPTEHQDLCGAVRIAGVVEVCLGYKTRTRWPPHTHQSVRERTRARRGDAAAPVVCRELGDAPQSLDQRPVVSIRSGGSNHCGPLIGYPTPGVLIGCDPLDLDLAVYIAYRFSVSRI